MIVCVCNNVSSKDIINYISLKNSLDLESLKKSIPCCNQCEICKHDIQDLLNSNSEEMCA